MIEPDSHDRRLRIIRRIPLGEDVAAESARAIAEIERRWIQEVGTDRYRLMIDVLGQLGAAAPYGR